jgi:hypothetical protein
LRAFRGETLQASQILESARRIIVVSPARVISETDSVAVIELPPARQRLHKELTIIGSGYRLAPTAGDVVQGDVEGRSAVRLIPLLNDRHDEPDAWVVIA